jgi:hypothetical protein
MPVITPVSALKAATLVYRLAPEIRHAIVAMLNAFTEQDDEAAREAYEAARRAAFAARQK